eukprot:762625-Hanusia_phi.AAC.3
MTGGGGRGVIVNTAIAQQPRAHHSPLSVEVAGDDGAVGEGMGLQSSAERRAEEVGGGAFVCLPNPRPVLLEQPQEQHRMPHTDRCSRFRVSCLVGVSRAAAAAIREEEGGREGEREIMSRKEKGGGRASSEEEQ